MDFDPEFFCDDDCREDYVYDTYDRIVDSPDEDYDDLSRQAPESMEDDYLDATAMGMAFALADEIADECRRRYDVDEQTDVENLKMVSLMQMADELETRNLRPFEQYIDEICKGKRALFKKD